MKLCIAMEISKILREIYYDPTSIGSLGSIEKLYHCAKKIHKEVSRADVKRFLKGSKVYTLHKLQRKRFPRRKIVAVGPRIILSCDLYNSNFFLPGSSG